MDLKFATSKSMFHARLPSIFSTCHKMPRLPQNLHLVTTSRGPDNAIRKNPQHDTSEVLRLPREMTTEVSKVLRLPRKLQRIFWKRRKSIAPATQKRFLTRDETRPNLTKCHARHAKRSYAMLETSKSGPFCRGTAIATSRERLWTVADGCERLRYVERTHPQPPDPQRETETLATYSGIRINAKY